jgi:hypothetical protein
MKKALFILSLFICLQVSGQVSPPVVPPVSPIKLTTVEFDFEPSTNKYFIWNGATYKWWQPISSTQLTNILLGYYPHPAGTTSQYIRGDGSLAILPSAAVYTASNGLTKVVNDIQDGGTLTSGVTKTVGDYSWNLSAYKSDFTTFSEFQFDNGQAYFITSAGINRNAQMFIQGNSTNTARAFIGTMKKISSVNKYKALDITYEGTGLSVVDDVDNIGLIYSKDNTAAQLANDRAITDVGGVKSLIATYAPNLSLYVPYTGATTDLNLGTHDFIGRTITAGTGNLSVGLYVSNGSGTGALEPQAVTVTDNTGNLSVYRSSYFGYRDPISNYEVKLYPKITGSTVSSNIDLYMPATSGTLITGTQTDSIASLKQDTSKTEHFLGQIFNRGTFTSTSGFTDVSSGVTVSGGTLNFATGSGDNTFVKQLQVTGNTALEKYRAVIKGVVLEKSATSYGFAFGTQSTYSGTGKINIAGKFDMTSNAASGQVSLVGGDITNLYPTLTTSTTALTWSVNDSVELVVERFINKFTVSIRNITTGSAYVSATVTMKFNGSAGIYQPNMGQFSLYNLGGAFKITSITITSREIKNPNVALIGDSKIRFGTQFITSNVATLLGITNNSVVVEAGRGNTTADMLTLINETLAINPKYAVLSFSSNDDRGGVLPATRNANYDRFVDSLVAHGIKVFHIMPLYEPALDQTSMASHLASSYPGKTISVSIVSTDLVDGTHLNEAGHLKEYYSITDAVKIQQGGKNETFKFILDQSNTLLTGLAGSQTVIGGASASENLTLTSTANATKGKVYFGSAQTTQFDEVNSWLGIKTIPTNSLTLSNTGNGFAHYNTVDQTTNLERATWSWVNNTYTLNVAASGTGTQRPLAIKLNSGRTFTINTVPTTLPTFQFGAGTSGAGAALGVDGTYNASASRQYMIGAAPTISQTSSAGSTILYAYPFYNTSGSGGDYLLALGTSTAADLGGTLSNILRISKTGLFQLNGTDLTANQIVGANSGATGMEAKTITGSAGTGQVVTNGAGSITLSNDTSVVRAVANSYSLAGMQTKLNNYVLGTRSITINGVTQDLSANRTYTIVTPIAASYSGTGTATTTFTVTIGSTQPNNTYKVNVTPTSLVAAAVFYVTNKTTTTFDVVYLAGLTGAVTFDWSLFQ